MFFIALLILIEILFKANPKAGFFAYIVFLLGSIFYLLYQKMDDYITFLLIIPVLRIAVTSFNIEPALQIFFVSFIMLTMILIKLNFSEHNILRFGFNLKHIETLTQRPGLIYILIIICLGIGSLAGIMAKSFISLPAFSDLLLFSVMFVSVVEEFYFRGILMTLNNKISRVLLIPFLYTALVFEGSFAFALIAFIFNLFACGLFYKYKTIYLPMLAHMALGIFLVVPKF